MQNAVQVETEGTRSCSGDLFSEKRGVARSSVLISAKTTVFDKDDAGDMLKG